MVPQGGGTGVRRALPAPSVPPRCCCRCNVMLHAASRPRVARGSYAPAQSALGAFFEKHASHDKLARKWCGRMIRAQMWQGQASVPVQMWHGRAPVPVRMWQGRAQSRCRCGSGEPSPSADVAAPCPVPVQMRQGWAQVPEQRVSAGLLRRRPAPVALQVQRCGLRRVPTRHCNGVSACGAAHPGRTQRAAQRCAQRAEWDASASMCYECARLGGQVP